MMPNEDGSDLVKLIASEISKQVPLRQALEPSAVELGSLSSDILKCVRLAFAPIQYLAVQQDRFRRFIERSAEGRPIDQRIEPAPQILGPILEGIRYEPEGSITDEAFSELLARAFDRERAHQAHPAFPGMLRVMADDEMKLFKKVSTEVLSVEAGTMIQGQIRSVASEIERPDFQYLSFPKQILAYATHLEALGLVHDLVAQDEEGADYAKPYKLYYKLHISALGELFSEAVFKD